MQKTTRQMLVETANDLFYQHGFHAIGLDQILTRVGVTKTTFYNHFESKDDLSIAVLHERDKHDIDEWLRVVRANGGGDPKQEILVLFDLLEEWLSHPDFRGCMFLKAASEFPSPNDPVHQAAMIHGANLHREIFQRAQRGGARDPGALAGQLMLLLAGAILSRQDRGVDPARSARAAAEVLVQSQMA